MLDWIVLGLSLGAIAGLLVYFFTYGIWFDFDLILYIIGGCIIGGIFVGGVIILNWWILVPIIMILFFIYELWYIGIIVLGISFIITDWWWLSVIIFIVLFLMFIFGGENPMETWVKPYTRRRYGKTEYVSGHKRYYWLN